MNAFVNYIYKVPTLANWRFWKFEYRNDSPIHSVSPVVIDWELHMSVTIDITDKVKEIKYIKQ